MAEARAQSSRLWLWIGAAVILVAVFFTARTLLRERLPVRAAEVDRETLVTAVSSNGKVEPERNYQFFSPIATTVKAVYAQPGDKVAAGKLLIVLDDIDARARVAASESGLKTAQASLYAATHNGSQQERQASAADIEREKLDLAQAQHNLDALTGLAAAGAASPSEVAAARQQLDSAQASLTASQQSASNRYSEPEMSRTQAAVADAEANLAAARQAEAQMEVRAPIAGTVYSLDATPTSYVEAGHLLLQMADLSHERVRAYFDEPDLGRLAVGQKISIKWDAKPSQEWQGHIERVPVTVITYGTRTVGEVLVQIDTPDSGLLPDTNVTVTVTISNEPDALTVPREALHFENGKPYVYKIVGDSLERTSVTTGSFNLMREEILSGLKEGDSVATGTTSGQPLQEGMPIKVVR
jgi:HlyD family secretion protein